MSFFDRFRKKKSTLPHPKKESIFVEKPAEKKVEKKEKEEVVVKKTERQIVGSAHRVMVKPLVSEKATIAESENRYTFVVEKNATKSDIKRAIKQIYGVDPLKVRVINVQGKVLRFGRKYGKRKDWKKAFVTLSKGQSIRVHEGV